ncbi:hypothetical protein ACLBWT_18570 [Paenibacillus sp. D51F]
MSKNKKVIFASVGVLLALILAVLLIRNPVEKIVAPEPPAKVETPAAPQDNYKPNEMDESHKKVASIVDEASAAVVREAPGLWGRVVDTWDWFMGFDAKTAIILIAVMVFVFGILATGGRSKRNQH